MAFLVAHVLVRGYFFLLVFLLAVLFSALVVFLHHLLDLGQLLRVQVDAHLLRDRDQIWRDFLHTFIFLLVNLHLVVLLLVLSHDFRNFAVNFVVQVLLVAVYFMDLLTATLTRVDFFGCCDRILDVK